MYMRGFFFCPSAFAKLVHSRVMTEPQMIDLEISDLALLRRYAATHVDADFAELVRRHLDLVYAAAFRQMRDASLAEDVTQAVFILLSQKAGKIKGSLAGWLINTTVFVAKNAKKMSARRQFHERQAGDMKARTTPPVEADDWNTYAPLLDDAISRLPILDREIVISRFLQGCTFAEVGALAGLSKEAARKRADRAVVRLRSILSQQGSPFPAVGVLTSHLQSNAMRVAPPSLHASVLAGGSTSARAIVHAMQWAGRMHALVGLCGIVLVLGGMIAAVLASKSAQQPANNPATPSTSGVPMTQTAATPNQPASIERTQPGLVQVKRWDVIVDPPTADVIKAAGQSIVTRSRVYEALRFPSDRLRRLVAQASDEHHALRVSHESESLPLDAARGAGWGLMWSFSYTDDPSFFFYEHEQPRSDEQSRQRQSPRQAHLAFDRQLNIQVSQPGTNGTRTPAAVQFDGVLIPGDSIGFLGTFSDREADVTCSHLVVYEAYAATPAEAAVMDRQLDTSWWCHHGPDTMRLWADQELLWAKDASGGRNFGPPSMEKKLDDGRSIWLAAFTRPSKYPLCWWDPAGNPLSNWQDAIPLDGNPPDGLWAQVLVGGTPQPQSLDQQMSTQRIADDAISIEVGVPTGPWQEVARIKPGGKVRVGTIRYELVDHNGAKWLRLFERGLIDDQTRATLIESDGKRDKPREEYQYFKWGRDRIGGMISLDLPAENDHASEVIIEQRKRQFVTFGGFRTQPISLPPSGMTRPQVDAALEQLRLARVQKSLDAFPSHRMQHTVGWFLGEPTDYNHAMMIFFHAAVSADERSIRRMLIASDPGAVAAMDPLAHLFAEGQNLRRSMVARFDEKAAHALLDRPGLFEDLLAELLNTGWSQLIDSDLPTGTDVGMWDDRSELLAWRLQKDKTYCLNIDGLAQRKDLLDSLKSADVEADKVQQMLSDRSVTLDQLQRELKRYLN